MTEIIEITNLKDLPKGDYRMYSDNPCTLFPVAPDKAYCFKHKSNSKKNYFTYYVPAQKVAPK